MEIIEKNLKTTLESFKNDPNKNWAAYAIIARDIMNADTCLGYNKTMEILKEVFGD